jgi:pyridoxamine 5'-phosphate oxidase-like protein
MGSAREPAPLSKDQCLRLVDSVPFGRIVFTSRAMPAVRLVPHARVGSQIIIPASPDLGVAADGPGTVVAYEADAIAPDRQPAWTVLVVGRAHRMAAAELAAGQRERLSSWPGGAPDEVIVITTDLVTGEQIPRGKAPRIPVQRIPAA